MAIKLSIFMVPTGRTALKTDSWFLWTSVCTLSPGWKWTGITLVITLFLDTNRGDFTESLIWSEQNETSTKWWITTKHDRAITVTFHKHRYNQTICDWFYRCCNKCVFLVSGRNIWEPSDVWEKEAERKPGTQWSSFSPISIQFHFPT